MSLIRTPQRDLSSRRTFQKSKMIATLVCVLSIVFTFSASQAFAQTPDSTTTVSTTTPETTTTVGLDADLPGATTVPQAGPTKEQTIA
ncbi:MAG TPA: hypothetical protein PLT55_05135, partial [Acidimicrobiia bacterium]|nr:hypothetical protein [Acidimicrobiia bacterium]